MPPELYKKKHKVKQPLPTSKKSTRKYLIVIWHKVHLIILNKMVSRKQQLLNCTTQEMVKE